MKFVKENFSGYSETCSTILFIKDLVKDREFTFEEICHIPSVTSEKFINLLQEDLVSPFVKYLFGTDYFEKKFNEIEDVLKVLKEKISSFEYEKQRFYKRFNFISNSNIDEELNFLDRSIMLSNRLDQILHKGSAIKVLETVFEESLQSKSCQTTNNVMHRAMCILLEVSFFKENEFEVIMKLFNFRYWGENSIESFYANAIIANNNSAWKSIEKAIKRKPFILQGKRMYEGRTFKIEDVEKKKWTYYRCTGWNSEKNIKFVTDKTEKQSRFSFDLKEFKAFFKDKKIEF